MRLMAYLLILLIPQFPFKWIPTKKFSQICLNSFKIIPLPKLFRLCRLLKLGINLLSICSFCMKPLQHFSKYTLSCAKKVHAKRKHYYSQKPLDPSQTNFIETWGQIRSFKLFFIQMFPKKRFKKEKFYLV